MKQAAAGSKGRYQSPHIQIKTEGLDQTKCILTM